MHVDARNSLSLRGPGSPFIDITKRRQGIPIDEESREVALPRQDYVLDVSRPPQSTPRWRHVAISWIHAGLLAELVGIVIFLFGLAVVTVVRGLVEIASWLGSALLP